MGKVGKNRIPIHPHDATQEPFPSGVKSDCISWLILYSCFPDGQESTQRRQQSCFLFSPGKFLNSSRIGSLPWKSPEGGETGDSSLSTSTWWPPPESSGILSQVLGEAVSKAVETELYFRRLLSSDLIAGSRDTFPVLPPLPKDIFSYNYNNFKKGKAPCLFHHNF